MALISKTKTLIVLTVLSGLVAASPAVAEEAQPVIAKERASKVTQSNAVLFATVTAGSSQTTYQAWMEDPCTGLAECIRDVLVGEGHVGAGRTRTVHAELATALEPVFTEPETAYGFWFTAKDATSTTQGPEASFTTLPAATEPSVLRERVTRITASDAVLHAEISTGALPTEWEIWLEDPCSGLQECIRDVRVAHGVKRPSAINKSIRVDLAAGEGDPEVAPGTAYSFWTVLKNGSGAVTAPPVTFTTGS